MSLLQIQIVVLSAIQKITYSIHDQLAWEGMETIPQKRDLARFWMQDFLTFSQTLLLLSSWNPDSRGMLNINKYPLEHVLKLAPHNSLRNVTNLWVSCQQQRHSRGWNSPYCNPSGPSSTWTNSVICESFNWSWMTYHTHAVVLVKLIVKICLDKDSLVESLLVYVIR